MIEYNQEKLIAEIYDCIYFDREREIDFWESICLNQKGRTLELMCGTGAITVPLSERGTNISAVDYSAEMLKIALRKNIDGNPIDYYLQDIVNLNLPHKKYKTIFIAVGSFEYLVYEEAQSKTLSNIYYHLDNNGSVYIELTNKFTLLSEKKPLILEISCPEYPELYIENQIEYQYLQRSNLFFIKNDYRIVDTHGNCSAFSRKDVVYIFTMSEICYHLKKVGFNKIYLFGDYNLSPYKKNSDILLIKGIR